MVTLVKSQVRYAPTADRLIVRRHEERKQSKGGVFLPQSFKEALSEGTVLAVGPGRRFDDGKLHQPAFSVGQVVLFHESAALDFDSEADDLCMLAESVVIGVKLVL